MASIGVRELRQDASRWLARVRAGESIVVTDRGRPIARMVPINESSGYDSLLEQGRIAPGTGVDFGEMIIQLDSDLPPESGTAVSDALSALRDDER
jgi:prevent-host-death family protein